MDNKALIQEYCCTKRLNFLIGSGASSDAIPLMGQFNSFGAKANEELLKCVKDISKKALLICKDDKPKSSIELNERLKIFKSFKSYSKFMEGLIHCLNNVNSRTIPRSVNIFTTNYDLFLECAIDNVLRTQNFVCNDGARGYFTKVLDWTNFNRVVAYKGINDNYNYELPLVNLIKPHGSVNWKREKENVLITPNVCENPFVVPPTGTESRETFLTNYFYEMLRVFQLELEKPQSVLIVIGFSFQDSHIAKMVRRAIQNPELRVYIFAYSDNAINYIRKNLDVSETDLRLIIWGPKNFESNPLTLKEVTKILFEKKQGDN